MSLHPYQQPPPPLVTNSNSFGRPTSADDEITQLRAHIEQLWKIIQKQRARIQSLLKDNVRLAAERDGILDKYQTLEKELGIRQQRQRAASILISPEMLREIAEAEDGLTTPSEATAPPVDFSPPAGVPTIVTTNLGMSSPIPPPRSPFRSVRENNNKPSGPEPQQQDVRVAQKDPASSQQQNQRAAKQFTLPQLSFDASSSPTDSPATPSSPTQDASQTAKARKARARESMMPPPRSNLLDYDPTMRAASPPLPRHPRHSLYMPTTRSNSSDSGRPSGRGDDNNEDLVSPQLPPNPPEIQEPSDLDQQQQSLNLANIAVKVIGSNIKVNERGKEVISFIISVGDIRPGAEGEPTQNDFHERWRVEKLYSDFLALDTKLKAQQNQAATSRIAKLPDKALFTTHAPSKVDQRKAALEQYLQHAVSLPWDDPSDLCEFLSTDVVDHDVFVATGKKEGYLTKRGKNFGGWKSRYFVLNDDVIDYYESKGGSHLGTIRLTNAQVGRQTSSVTPTGDDANSVYRHAFLLMEQRRAGSTHVVRHILCAESDKDRDEWVDAIVQNIRFDNEPPSELLKGKKDKQPKKGGRKLSKGEIRTISAVPVSQLKQDQENEKLTSVPTVMEPEAVVGVAISSGVGPTPSVSSESTDSSLLSTSLPSAASGWPEGRASLDHGRSLNTPQQPLIRRSSMVNLLNSQEEEPQPPQQRALSPTPGRTSEDSPEDGSSNNDKKPKNKANRMTFWGKKMFSSSSSSSSNNNNNNDNSSDNSGPNAPRPSTSSSNTSDKTSTSTTSGFRSFLSRSSNDSNDRSKQAPPSPQPEVPGPKQVFGVPLEEAVRVSRVVEGYELPSVVYRCIEYLDAKNAVMEEGLYRLSGSSTVIKNLRQKFNKEGDVNLLASKEEYDVHAIAGLLKMWLRELPTSVLTRELRTDFLHVIDLLDRKDRVNELGRLVSQLPLANYTLLRALTAHLIRVVQHSDVNKMTMRNVSIVFSPTLGIPAMIFNLFMSEFDYVFWTTEEGDAAPRRVEEEEGNNKEDSRKESDAQTTPAATASTSETDQKPNVKLGRTPTLKLREEGGRSNRNSVSYLDGAPSAIVELERHMDGRPVLDEDEDEVDELALSAQEPTENKPEISLSQDQEKVIITA